MCNNNVSNYVPELLFVNFHFKIILCLTVISFPSIIFGNQKWNQPAPFPNYLTRVYDVSSYVGAVIPKIWREDSGYSGGHII